MLIFQVFVSSPRVSVHTEPIDTWVLVIRFLSSAPLGPGQSFVMDSSHLLILMTMASVTWERRMREHTSVIWELILPSRCLCISLLMVSDVTITIPFVIFVFVIIITITIKMAVPRWWHPIFLSFQKHHKHDMPGEICIWNLLAYMDFNIYKRKKKTTFTIYNLQNLLAYMDFNLSKREKNTTFAIPQMQIYVGEEIWNLWHLDLYRFLKLNCYGVH